MGSVFNMFLKLFEDNIAIMFPFNIAEHFVRGERLLPNLLEEGQHDSLLLLFLLLNVSLVGAEVSLELGDD
jgi:hypothetical protein